MNVLHTYLFGFHFFGGFPARVLRVPVVISSRREIAYWQKRRHLWLENAGNLFADHVICCSKAAQNWTLKKERGQAQKTAVIYNGVDLTRFGDTVQGLKIRREFGIPYQAPLVGTVANFSFEKGYVYLLEAIGFVLKENPETWFLLVGGGTLHDEIKQKAKQIPRFGQIVFTGFRSDIPELIDAMDVFTLASVIEGFPNVLLEAMAMAKPIVATETGGIPELIQTGREGVLVPPGNSKALADAILAFFKDRMWASRLGVQGQERIRLNFTLERMVDDYENFYLSSLRKRRPERGKNQEDRTKSVAEPSSVFMEH
jgi:glycosyltransferase involved in cell wall biosynthesis